MNWFILSLGVFLAIVGYRHRDTRLEASSYICAGAYAIYFLFDNASTNYVEKYSMYLAVDLIWLGLMYSARAPILALIAVLLNVGLGALLLYLPNHWLLFGHYWIFYLAIQTLLVLSLTILPKHYPSLAKGLPPYLTILFSGLLRARRPAS